MRWINPKAFVQKRIMISLAVCLLTIVPALAQTGGGYDLSWCTIDGGGILIYDLLLTPPKDSGSAIFTPPQADLRY